MKIVIDGERPPTWNKLYSGVHWSVRKRMADDAHTLIRCAVGPDVQTFDVPVKIRVTAHFKHRPLDADNIMAKLYIDGLVLAGVIAADDPKHVVSVTTASYVDREWPRLVITVEPNQ